MTTKSRPHKVQHTYRKAIWRFQLQMVMDIVERIPIEGAAALDKKRLALAVLADLKAAIKDGDK